MIKRELKVNFKSFCIWSIASILLFLVVFLIYPSIMNGPEADKMNELMKLFPEEILKAFNMDISSLDSAYGWLKSEGFVFILLIIGCYSGLLGGNILLKEENDKTIEYLSTLPITRNKIIISKSIVGLIYIIGLTLVIGLFNLIGLLISCKFDLLQYILLSITPLFPSIVIFFLCMFISTFTHKSRKMQGLSLAVVLISYVLNTLSSLSDNVKFIKYFSVFTLADIRNVITEVSINPLMIIISQVISIIFFFAVIIRYNKKELI